MSELTDNEVEVCTPHLVSFNTLSQMGLVYRLNKVLHPLGLALGYEPVTGESDGALVADDGVWEYSPEIEAGGKERFEKFLELRAKMTIQEVIEQYKGPK